jgi:hypothetical protein
MYGQAVCEERRRSWTAGGEQSWEVAAAPPDHRRNQNNGAKSVSVAEFTKYCQYFPNTVRIRFILSVFFIFWQNFKNTVSIR